MASSDLLEANGVDTMAFYGDDHPQLQAKGDPCPSSTAGCLGCAEALAKCVVCDSGDLPLCEVCVLKAGINCCKCASAQFGFACSDC